MPFRSFTFVFIAALLTLHGAQAQVMETIRIASIPHPLTWNNKPLAYSLDRGTLSITAGPKTDMFRDPNVTYNTDNAPKLLFDADDDFVLSAGIQHPFSNKWDGGALVLIEDPLNWIKFCFERDYTGAKRIVSVVTKDISDDCNSVSLTGTKVYFKIAKAANVITLYYATDNKKWFLVRHLQFNNRKKLKLGFLAQSPTGQTCTVAFSDISYAKKRISDPYLGE